MLYDNASERVAPHGGAWIEIEDVDHGGFGRIVAPHGGAWIEMSKVGKYVFVAPRRPSRRGVD